MLSLWADWLYVPLVLLFLFVNILNLTVLINHLTFFSSQEHNNSSHEAIKEDLNIKPAIRTTKEKNTEIKLTTAVNIISR